MVKKYVIALYIRLSIDDKTIESMSIESQQAILRKFAETLGIDNIEIIEYIDNGYTGTNFERPSVQRLLEDVKAFKIDCIIVKDFSRFGRNSIEVGYFTQQVFPLYNDNNGYTYKGFNIITDTDGDFTYSNINSITPLQTMGIHCLIDCPKEVETSENPLVLTIKLRDGKEYLYTVR